MNDVIIPVIELLTGVAVVAGLFTWLAIKLIQRYF